MPRVRRSRWRKRISTRSSERRMMRGLAFVMVAVILGSALAYIARNDTGVGETGTGPMAAKPPAMTTLANKPPTTSEEAAAAYLLRQGGPQAMEAIKSARFTGTYTLGNHVYSMEILKKAPNLVRFQLEDKLGTLMLGNDGQRAWLAYRNAAGQIRVWDADEATRDWLWLQAPLGTWLAHPDAPGAKFDFGARPAAAGSAWPVSVLSPGGRKATYYLEDKDMVPQRLELLDTQPGAPAQVVDLENIRTQKTISVPSKLVVQGPAGPAAVLEIKQVAFNSGMLNETFARPTADDPKAASPGAGAPPSGGGGNPGAGGLGFNENFNNSFNASAVKVHNFVAETGPITSAPARLEPEADPSGQTTNQPPTLAAYGFPWPVPW